MGRWKVEADFDLDPADAHSAEESGDLADQGGNDDGGDE